MEKTTEFSGPFTPAARAFLIKNFGEDWVKQRQFIAERMTLNQVRKLLPWLKAITSDKVQIL